MIPGLKGSGYILSEIKNVLVTGSSGFIGRNLVASLRNCNSYRVSTLERVSLQDDVHSLNAVSSWGGFDEVCSKLVGVDAIVHLGGVVHRPKCSWDEYFRGNVLDTKFLAEAAVQAGVQRLVFLSSVSVFGGVTEQAFNEDSATRPLGWYGHSKLLAETLLQEFSENHSLEVVIVRPPMVYGRGGAGTFSSLSKFIERFHFLAVSSHPNSRSFISIDNLVSFVSLVITHRSAAGEVFVVSDGYDLSTKEFALLVARAKKTKIFIFPIPVGFLYKIAGLLGQKRLVEKVFGSFVLDISKARHLLRWTPPLAVSDALERCFD